MKILLLIISIIVTIAIAICLMAFGWHLHIKKEIEQEKGGCIILDGDITADSRYYYVRVFKSDGLVDYLKVPKFNAKHTLNVSAYQSPVKIVIKNK